MSATRNISSEVTAEDIAWLETKLKDAQCWLHAAELLTANGRDITDTGKRWIRKLAAESDWVISGDDGYKHVVCASGEEVEHFALRMHQSADSITARADRIRKNKLSLN